MSGPATTKLRRADVLVSGGFAAIPAGVMASRTITPAAKLVYAALLDHLGQNVVTFPSQTLLAAETGMAERSVRDALRMLADGGLIVAHQQPGRVTVYSFNPPPPPPPRQELPGSADPTPAEVAGVPRQELPDTPATVAGPPRQELPDTPATVAAELLNGTTESEPLNGTNAPATPPADPPASATATRPKRNKATTAAADPPPVPAELSTPAFAAAWSDWQRHRREKRNTLTPSTAVAQLEKLAGLGEPRAVVAIRHSIANGWVGIFEPKPQHGAAHHVRGSQRPVTGFKFSHDLPDGTATAAEFDRENGID